MQAVHRSGQTFLTWEEVGGDTQYHIYRSDQPITTATLSDASLLTSRWGPIDQDSSFNKFGAVGAPDHFIIEDGGSPLEPDTGLFVYTTQAGESGTAYYAVTSTANGRENKEISVGSNAVATAVEESVSTPVPVLAFQFSEGLGRIYTQFMDYSNWNPTLNGYAFSYIATLPHNAEPTRSYPLQISLHEFGGRSFPLAHSENNWETIQIFPSDPGLSENTMHTWWYGHAADHNYLTDGMVPDSGTIENFTEQRIVRAVNEIIANPDFSVDTDAIHVAGNSMGASGALSLACTIRRYSVEFTQVSQ